MNHQATSEFPALCDRDDLRDRARFHDDVEVRLVGSSEAQRVVKVLPLSVVSRVGGGYDSSLDIAGDDVVGGIRMAVGRHTLEPNTDLVAADEYRVVAGMLPSSGKPTECFIPEKEYLGRVRDVDHERRVFLAVLGEKDGDEEDEVVGKFRFELVADKIDRLVKGAVFTLVTGYRHRLSADGAVIRAGMDTRIFIQQPRHLADAARRMAHRLADQLYDDEPRAAR